MTGFGRGFERRGLRVNVGNSIVMRCSRYVNGGGICVRLNGDQLEEVYCFKYLDRKWQQIEDVIAMCYTE